MNNLTKADISHIAQAAIEVSKSNDMTKSINLNDNEWFNVFKNPESKKDTEIDVVLMNGCASTPFMFFVDVNDKDIASAIETNASRILEEYHSDLVIDMDEPELEF